MREIAVITTISILVLICCTTTFAAEIAGSTTTIPYYYQQYLRGEEQSYLALYEFADFAGYDLGTEGLDLYFSGWGRLDTMQKLDPEDEAIGDGHLQSAYIRWRHYEGLADLALGRQLITTGPMCESFDGLYARIRPLRHFGIEGFGGIPVISMVGERDGDWGYGGRAFLGWYPWFEIGGSAAGRTEKDDPDREMVGADLTIQPADQVDVFAHAYFDTLYSSLYDVDGLVIVRPVIDMKFLAQYERLIPSAFLGMGSWFSVFSYDTIQKVNSEIAYTIVNRVVLATAYNLYIYDEQDNANRFGGSVGILWGKSRQDTLNLGAYKLDRDDNGYTELRGYLYQTMAKGFFGTLDGNGYLLDEDIYGVGAGFDGSISLGWSATEELDLSASAFYRSSPYYEQDVRGLIKIAYNFSRIF